MGKFILKLDEAKPLFEQSLAIQKQVFGETHPQVTASLKNLRLLWKAQEQVEGKLSEGKPLHE